ncbi:Ger(x)C family spore germination protein [Clostridium tyrobutyricum]|uniref:Ger(x)C family spore germination protein n=1 Tax=Clostridium tyrobutyricum TaxID=1519 RepID=UPI001C386110|nr:Ger(x)C family spore germination protein [Clostridium tyrobutyricum]MBV4417856.1 Ger(x)C family spore germination protein [Clostridium tyrobutyricum]
MNKFKRLNLFILIIIFSFCPFIITGCQDKNEIDSLGFVSALGVDLDDNNNFMVSLQVIRRGISLEQNQNTRALVYVSSGKTINEAISNISRQLSKKIKFSNEKCIVIGEKLAEHGIQSVIDFSLRVNDVRPVVPILITKGTAVDIIKTRTKENSISGYDIGDMVRVQRDLGVIGKCTNLDFEKNKNEGVNVCGVISKQDLRDNKSEYDFTVSGSAVLNKYKLVGYMNEEETRGMNWINGKIKRGSVLIKDDSEGKINLNILSSKSRLTASIEPKGIHINVNIKEKSNINEINQDILHDLDFNANPNIMYFLAKKQDEAIYNEAMSAINASKNRLSADIFGFGDLLYKKHPKEWKQIKENWNENFRNLQINVDVSSSIKHTGILSKSISY